MTNKVARINWAKTDDQKKLVRAQDYLDSGEEREAMRLARELISSPDREVRSDVVSIFCWVGKRALPELIVLMNDRDETIAEEALRGYEFAINEISSDYGKMSAITNAVVHLEKAVFIETLLQNLDGFDQKQVLLALDRLIAYGAGASYGVCAKKAFEDFAGEPWVSPEQTRKLISQKKED